MKNGWVKKLYTPAILYLTLFGHTALASYDIKQLTSFTGESIAVEDVLISGDGSTVVYGVDAGLIDTYYTITADGKGVPVTIAPVQEYSYPYTCEDISFDGSKVVFLQGDGRVYINTEDSTPCVSPLSDPTYVDETCMNVEAPHISGNGEYLFFLSTSTWPCTTYNDEENTWYCEDGSGSTVPYSESAEPNIWRMSLKTGELKRWVGVDGQNQYGAYTDYSGSHLVYYEGYGAGTGAVIRHIKNGGAPKTIREQAEGVAMTLLDFSADGEQILVTEVSWPATGRTEEWKLIRLEDSAEKNIAAPAFVPDDADFAVFGRRGLSFSAETVLAGGIWDDKMHVYVLETDGSEYTPVVEAGSYTINDVTISQKNNIISFSSIDDVAGTGTAIRQVYSAVPGDLCQAHLAISKTGNTPLDTAWDAPDSTDYIPVHHFSLKNESQEDVSLDTVTYEFVGTDKEVDDYSKLGVNALLYLDENCDRQVTIDDVISMPTPVRGGSSIDFTLAETTIAAGSSVCLDLRYTIYNDEPACKTYGAIVSAGSISASCKNSSTIAGEASIGGGSVQGTIKIVTEEGCDFIVNSNADTSDADPGDRLCDTGAVIVRDGIEEVECTFRAAIEEANAFKGEDTILFDIPAGNVLNALTSLPSITDPVDISGKKDGKRTVIGFDAEGLDITAGDSSLSGFELYTKSGDAITISGPGENTITDVYIGTTVDAARKNSGRGIVIDNSPSNTIGGGGVADRVVIGGCGSDAVVITGTVSKFNEISGSYIGVTPDGVTSSGQYTNSGSGIVIQDGSSNLLYDNIITSNTKHGIVLTGSAQKNRISANLIGANLNYGNIQSCAELGSGNALDGVFIEKAAAENMIGGNRTEDGNVIHCNGRNGVGMAGWGNGNAVLTNNIYRNTALAVDLGLDGVNDPGSGSSTDMPNDNQHAPVLGDSPTISAGQVSLDVNTCEEKAGHVRVQLFVEHTHRGMDYMNDTMIEVTTDDQCIDLPMVITHYKLVPADKVVATATDSDNNTSEFSLAATIVQATDSDSDGAGDETENNAPNSGDGNLDGIADSSQSGIASFPDINNSYVTVEAPERAVLQNVYISKAPPSAGSVTAQRTAGETTDSYRTAVTPPDSSLLEQGCYGFTVVSDNTLSSPVRLLLPDTCRDRTVYYNYGKTSDNGSEQWYTFMYDGATGAEIQEKPIGSRDNGTEVLLYLDDGQIGDHDLSDNGSITTFGCAVCMEPSDNNTLCPVTQLSGGNRELLQNAYLVRDAVLSGSRAGRTYRDMYYRHAGEISGLLADDPALFGEAKQVLFDGIPALLTGGQADIDEGLLKRGRVLIKRLMQLSGDTLRCDLQTVLNASYNPGFLKDPGLLAP